MLKGNERVFMRKAHRRGTGKRRRTVYRNHLGFFPIIDANFPLLGKGSLDTGQYSFPFSIQLPDWLPASMSIGRQHERARLNVEYKLVAHFVPTILSDWADDNCNLSSFHAQIPLYITRP